MRSALWLYLYLLLNADRRTGGLKRKLNTIGTDMGMSRDTVLRWLGSLRKGGYVETRSNGRCLFIRISKWRPLAPKGTFPLPKQAGALSRGGRNATSQVLWSLQKTAPPKEEPAHRAIRNERSIPTEWKRIDIETRSLEPSTAPDDQFFPKTREELLALDLAQGLDDRQGLPLYLSYARRYPEGELRAIMGSVKEIPAERIRRSRGALFNHLVKQRYAKQSQDHPGG
jgi:hypothetical protein